MNYIKEMNAFYDWLEFNEVTPSAINLWHALMHVHNKTRWAGSFTVAESVLSVKTGLTGRTLRNARAELKQFGRIDFVSVRGKAPCYTIFSLVRSEEFSEVRAEVGTAVRPEVERSENIAEAVAEEGSVLRAAVDSAVVAEIERSEKIAEVLSAPSSAVITTLVKQNETKQNKTTQHQQQSKVLGEEVADDGYSKLATFYEQNIGPLTPHVGEMLGHLETESGAALTLHALEKAVEANANSKVKYAEAVLRGWRTQNVTTVEQVSRLNRKHNGKKRSLFAISEETLDRQKNVAKQYEHQDIDLAALPF